MGNPYLDYIHEKDPRDTYETAFYYGSPLGLTLMFRTPPNNNYWNRLIIPEITRMALDNDQSVSITEDLDGNLREIEIKPPDRTKYPKCVRSRVE